MKLVLILFLLIILLLNASLQAFITMICTIIWFIYTIIFCIKLLNKKDEKIDSNGYILDLPSNTSPEFIRYFYKRKFDNKVFITTLFNMVMKKFITIVRENDYYFVDNTDEESVLTKREESVRRILFKEMGNGENVSLTCIKKSSIKNSAYLYNYFQEFRSTFEYEVASEKYFKPTKNVTYNSMFYLAISYLIAFYNLFFIPYVIIFILIFSLTSIITIMVNGFKNIEEDKKEEYKNWIKFKNYVVNKNLSELDIEKLESFSLYAYSLDCYKEFKESLYLKKYQDEKCFDNSLILQLMSTEIFDDIVKVLDKSITNIKLNTILLFKKNKGRRVKI